MSVDFEWLDAWWELIRAAIDDCDERTAADPEVHARIRDLEIVAVRHHQAIRRIRRYRQLTGDVAAVEQERDGTPEELEPSADGLEPTVADMERERHGNPEPAL